MAKRPPADEALLRRALLYWRVPGVRAAEVCARYGVARRELTHARKEVPVVPTREDLVCMALVGASRPVPAARIIAFIDWIDHARWRDEELARVLRGLEATGTVRREGDGWALAAEWP